MKAIVVRQFGAPEVMKLEPLPDPVPGPGQVLLAVKAAGVNPVEAYVRSGNYGNLPPLPYTPGADAAGFVEAVGPDVASPKPGDRVYGVRASGAYAEKVLVPAAFAFPLPDNISFAQGAALGVPYSTAHRALFHKGGAKKGETLLVHGASGGVGTAAIQLAKRAGLRVLGTGGTPEGRDLVKTQGADEVLDHHDPAFADKLKAATGGRGVDLIVEMAAHTNLGKDLGFLAKFGRVVVVGSRGPVEINPRDLMTRDAEIRALTIFNASPEELVTIHQDLVAGLAEGKLSPVIGREFPLAEAAAAHQAVMAAGAQGKVVLIP